MKLKIKDIKELDRPREKVFAKGIESLSNEELIAILLRTGTPQKSALVLSAEILNKIRNIYDLRKLTVEELMQIDGIKRAKAATMIAAIELGKRLHKIEIKDKFFIREIEDVYKLLGYELSVLEQEHLVCLYVDVKGGLIKKETIYIGTLNQTPIHPRDVFLPAVKLSAAGMILVHNHPSGDSKPSASDYKVTSKIQKAADIFEIDLIDHIIIGKNELYSIKANKRIYI